MKKSTQGILIALAGAVALVLWWRRRQSGPGQAASPLANIGQLGGDFQQDVSGEIVKANLDFAQRQLDRANCARYYTSDGVHDYYKDGMGNTIKVTAFTYPPNHCANFGLP